MPSTEPPLLELSGVRAAAAARTGPKIGRLGELAAQGWRVPDGYVLTVDALDQWLPAATRHELERLFDEPTTSPGALDRMSARARALIEKQPMPGWLEDAVGAAHERLQKRTGLGSELLVAVRSSAVSEDSAAASFAGQFDTYLGIRGSEAVLEHIRKCWASLYTSRVLNYRSRRGLPLRALDLAVGVLELVEARSAGVVFTLDPVTGDRGSIVVQGNWGLGESVVSGQVTPDHWVYDRVADRIRERRIADKHVWSIVDSSAGSAETAPAPIGQRERPCLDEEEVRYLCRQAARLESQEGEPQDIEWAIERRASFPDNLVILQHRPDTSATAQVTPSPPPQDDNGPFDPVGYALRNVFKVPGR